jgi:hypothetical protein
MTDKWDETCLNCGTALSGRFCSKCGQRAVPPHPSTRELAADAFNELSGWDGRFAVTIRTLIRRPGELTREFLAGHRARYISPLRLYLVASLVYFVAAAAAPNMRGPNVVEAGGFRVGVFTPLDSVDRAAGRTVDPSGLTAEQRAEALKQLDESPAWMRPVLRQAIDDPQRLQRSMLSSLPRLLFALVPVFAVIVSLFYRGRHFPEHLYFALHFHAMIFAVLTLNELAKMTRYTPLIGIAGVGTLIWIIIYGLRAFQRVYAESPARTAAKAVGIGVLYVAVSIPAVVSLVVWAAARG